MPGTIKHIRHVISKIDLDEMIDDIYLLKTLLRLEMTIGRTKEEGWVDQRGKFIVRPGGEVDQPAKVFVRHPVRIALGQEEQPAKVFVRHSKKYDAVLDEFMEGTESLVAVDVSGKDGSYLKTQLNKRIDARKLRRVKVSVVNNVCYLEKEEET